MPDRNAMTRVLLVLYAVGSVAVAIPLAFAFADSGDLANTTSGKILAGALLALGIGAVLAIRDPWQNRIVITVIMIFTTLAALAIAYRLVVEHYSGDPSWFLLPVAIAAPILFAVFYPRRPGD